MELKLSEAISEYVKGKEVKWQGFPKGQTMLDAEGGHQLCISCQKASNE